jgi:hypothetical protein
MMRNWLFFVLLSLPAGLHAQTDVALVDLVSGDVTYGPNRAKVSAFMKVRAGDRFTVARGAQVRLLYLDSAQQEHFSGPASFTAGSKSSALQSGSQPRVSKVPGGVPQRIARIPELLQHAKLGGVQIRSKPPAKADEALREARALYTQMRKERRKDDITPELFLYSTLSDYHRYDEMRPVAEEMLRRQPDNEEVKALAAAVK